MQVFPSAKNNPGEKDCKEGAHGRNEVIGMKP
jgi:hypothetical protein